MRDAARVAQLGAALEQVNAGALDQAAAICAALTAQAPDDPAVWQLHATIALREGRSVEAHASAERSLRLRPGHAPSLILAGQAALAAGDADAALAHARAATARAPEVPEAAFLLCHALLATGDPALDEAIRAAARRHPNAATAWLQLASALRRAGHRAAALAAFTRAASASPGSAQAEFGLGLMLREASRLPEARIALQRATAIEPAHGGAWFALGLTCQDLQDEAGAEAAYRAALASKADFAEAAVNLGIALQRQGRMEAAMDAYREAVRIRPDTFGRIAQAMTASATGMLCLDLSGLHRRLGG